MASVDNFEKPVEQPRTAHTALEDVLAIVIGTLMVSFGVVMLRQVGALTGGTAGMAFLAHYLTQVSFGTAFFIINLPFYYLSIRRMGWQFTLKPQRVALVRCFRPASAFHSLRPSSAVYATLFATLYGHCFIVLFLHKPASAA